MQSTENSLPWLLKTNSTTRQKALDLLVFISGVPDTETSPNQLFALRFLEKNKKDGQSVIDHVLVDAQDNNYTAANSPASQGMTGIMAAEPSEEKLNSCYAEMKSIGLLVGNLALDGISARELLTKAVLQYKFVDRIINALTSS